MNSRLWRMVRAAVMHQATPVPTAGVLVLGMHRSGTSCLTGLLETCGLWAGVESRRSTWNPKGNFEREELVELNDRILERCGGSWSEPPPPEELVFDKVPLGPVARALEPFRKHEPWLLKDPRMLLTFPLGRPLFPKARLVGTFRHPRAVAESLSKRGRIAVPEDQGIALWERYNRVLVERHRAEPFPLVNFDLDGPEYLRRFAALCETLDLPHRAEAARDFFEANLVFHRREGVEGLPAATRELFEYLTAHQFAG